jgi:hypothetical protein
MQIKSFILLGFVLAGLQACTPSATTPELPPIQTAPTESPEQAAIGNSQVFDQEMSAAGSSAPAKASGQ